MQSTLVPFFFFPFCIFYLYCLLLILFTKTHCIVLISLINTIYRCCFTFQHTNKTFRVVGSLLLVFQHSHTHTHTRTYSRHSSCIFLKITRCGSMYEGKKKPEGTNIFKLFRKKTRVFRILNSTDIY